MDKVIAEKVYLECDCSAKDHIICLSLWDWGDDEPVWVRYRHADEARVKSQDSSEGCGLVSSTCSAVHHVDSVVGEVH